MSGHPKRDEKEVEAFERALMFQRHGREFEGFEDWAFDHAWPDYSKESAREIWDEAGKVAAAIGVATYFKGTTKTAKDSTALTVVCAADVTPESIDWVWTDRLAKRKMAMLAGDPGQGKSQTSLNIAATISKGGKFPDGERAPKGSVIILSAEDGPSDTTIPRLMAAGADLRKVQLIRATQEKGNSRVFSLKADLPKLEALIEKLEDVVLVVIDPVTSYLADVDTHRTNEVRSSLEPLGNLAEKHDIAVLLISHPPKAAQAKAINAVTGSLAFVGVVRTAFVAIADSAIEGRSLLLPVKTNIGKMAKGLGYTIEGRKVEGPKGEIDNPSYG